MRFANGRMKTEFPGLALIGTSTAQPTTAVAAAVA